MFSRVVQVVRDRRNKDAMSEASYWDKRAQQRSGFARSVWHSQSFSRVWDERQQEILGQALRRCLGGLSGKKIVDIGCGTGRITRQLAGLGASAVGVDFSPETVRAAQEEADKEGLDARFVQGDVKLGKWELSKEEFDGAVAVGCLAVACTDVAELDAALGHISSLVRPGGAVLLFEPIHRSRLLRRLLKASERQWLHSAAKANLRLERSSGMGFVPARLALASFDWPQWLVTPSFEVGELVLDQVPFAERLSDYRLLELRRF